jgi:hypothetical protein
MSLHWSPERCSGAVLSVTESRPSNKAAKAIDVFSSFGDADCVKAVNGHTTKRPLSK